MHRMIFSIFVIFCISLIPYSFSEEIPEWVKNTAGWWSERNISQSEFVNGLEFLINEGVIHIPPTEPGPPGPDKIIPDWVRNTAGWWSDGKIPNSEFINAMKFLIEIGIIDVSVSTPEIIETIEEENQEEFPPLNIVLDGNPVVHQNKNFLLDIKVFNLDQYSGIDYSIHRKGIDGVNVTIELYNQEGELLHNYSDVTKYSGLVEYEVLAKETSQSRGLWFIGNTYNVKVTATLGDSIDVKNWEFVGIPDEYAFTQGSKNKPPINLTATAGNDQVSLSWSAPKGVSDITDYRIEYCKINPNAAENPNFNCPDTASGNYWTAFSHDPTDIVGCNNVTIERTAAEGGNYTFVVCDADVSDVVTGLENETQYLFRVAAINYSGTGAFTPTVTATTT